MGLAGEVGLQPEWAPPYRMVSAYMPKTWPCARLTIPQAYHSSRQPLSGHLPAPACALHSEGTHFPSLLRTPVWHPCD